MCAGTKGAPAVHPSSRRSFQLLGEKYSRVSVSQRKAPCSDASSLGEARGRQERLVALREGHPERQHRGLTRVQQELPLLGRQALGDVGQQIRVDGRQVLVAGALDERLGPRLAGRRGWVQLRVLRRLQLAPAAHDIPHGQARVEQQHGPEDLRSAQLRGRGKSGAGLEGAAGLAAPPAWRAPALLVRRGHRRQDQAQQGEQPAYRRSA